MVTVEDAKDIIDIYGPHRKRWPPVEAAQIDALLKSDKDLADYLKTQQDIDKQLNSWQEDLDGASIDDDGDDDGDNDNDGGRDDEDESFDDEDQDSEEEQESQSGGDADGDGGEARPPITLDPEQITDMDQLFADTIKGLVNQEARGKFNVFSRDKDGFVDIKVPDGTTTEGIDQAVQKAVGPLMKDLRRLIAARSQVRRIPGKRSGRLHAPSLHRVKLGDDRVFSRKEESPSLDTAITLLIDCSGSMNGAELKLATETAYALATVLNKLNIAFECIGFTDGWPGYEYPNAEPAEMNQWMRDCAKAAHDHPIGRVMPLLIARFKAFEDRWIIPTQKRFAAVFGYQKNVQMGSTPEGCGLEFAAKRLLARKEARKILICMTDGQPGCSEMNCSGEKSPSDMQHSIDMVNAIGAAGIDLVGIGIKHSGPTAYYPKSLVINNVMEMPKLLMGVLKQFIIG